MPNSKVHSLVGEVGALARTYFRAARKVQSDLHHPISHEGEQLSHADVRFEHTDASAPKLVALGAGLIITIWILVALLYLYFSFLSNYRAEVSPPPLPSTLNKNPLPPQPRLQASPQQELKAYVSQQNWMLDHYGWIDKDKGIVAIPIDRAMAILAARGIPPQKAPPNLVLSQPQAGTRLTGFEGKVEPEP